MSGKEKVMKEGIRYKSTNGKVAGLSFREALLKGLAPDGGLFMPEKIPVLSPGEIIAFRDKEYHEVAAEILLNYVGGEITQNDLSNICRDAYDFPVPLEKVANRKYILRLDQGPTASFKDFAARMMSRLMQYYLSNENKKLLILTATSGDTGSAVANAFYGLDNIKVIVLYPRDEVSPMQRKQMTTLGGNITVVAIDGKFDDCQDLVKQAFVDESLRMIPLSSANSINIGRLLPQMVYYFYAWSRLEDSLSGDVIFSVPSGNFGNLSAGLFARRMGLPVKKFIVATNANDEVPVFLRSGKYSPVVPSRNCISSAMNVGHPSNLARIIALYGGIMDERGLIKKQPSPDLTADLAGYSVTDDETRLVIKEMWDKHKVLLEPHGAVAWKGILEHSKESGNRGTFISLETAHPAKFPDEIRKILNLSPALPPSISKLASKSESFEESRRNYSYLKELIQQQL